MTDYEILSEAFDLPLQYDAERRCIVDAQGEKMADITLPKSTSDAVGRCIVAAVNSIEDDYGCRVPVPPPIAEPAELLGGGEDLTSRLVNYWGRQWIIIGKNYKGDWDGVRFRIREDGVRVRQQCSVPEEVYPYGHAHYAELIPPISPDWNDPEITP